MAPPSARRSGSARRCGCGCVTDVANSSTPRSWTAPRSSPACYGSGPIIHTRVRGSGQQYPAVSAISVRMRRRPLASSHDDQQGQPGRRRRRSLGSRVAQASPGSRIIPVEGRQAVHRGGPQGVQDQAARGIDQASARTRCPGGRSGVHRRSIASRTDPGQWMMAEIDDPQRGRTIQIGVPIRFSKSPGGIKGPVAAAGSAHPTKFWPDLRKNRHVESSIAWRSGKENSRIRWPILW